MNKGDCEEQNLFHGKWKAVGLAFELD
jgi:hypothetical protein